MLTGWILAIIFFAWALAIFAGLMSEIKAFKKFLGIIVTAVFFFVPLAIILGAYGTIFHIARAHARGVGKSSFKKVMGFLYFIIFLLNQKRSWL